MTFPKMAMVLSAGLGLRMRPLSEHTPKPLLKVGAKTMLDHTLDALARAGVESVAVNTHWLGEQVEAHVKARSGSPQCTLVHEDPVLETGGGIHNALQQNLLANDAPFFAVNADQIWIDGEASALTRLAQAWNDAEMDALLLLQPCSNAIGYEGAGDFIMDQNGRLSRGGGESAMVYTGVQLLHPRLFKGAPGGAYSMNVLYESAIKNERLFGMAHDGAWLHMGTPKQLAQANAYMKSKT